MKQINEPNRKRGFHRALKRGEEWAKNRKKWEDMDKQMKMHIDSLCFDISNAMFHGSPIYFSSDWPPKK